MEHRDEITTDDEPAVADLSKDDLFHILQNQRRRRVLKYLQATDKERVDMRDVAEQVAAWEHDTTLRQLTSDERQRVYIALYQSHLPKLDEKGIVEYNQSRGVVERTALADRFDHYLNGGSQEDTASDSGEADAATSAASVVEPTADSTRYYGSATAIGVALTAASWVGVAPTALSSSLATFITGMFLFVTVGLAYRNRN
nr:hypothetical protein [Halogranum amylolyticum]